MNKYQRVLKPSIIVDGHEQDAVIVDVYDVCDAFPLDKSMSAIDHARKKLLAMGMRGHKDFKQDLIDVRDSINRAIEQLEIGDNAPKCDVADCRVTYRCDLTSTRYIHCKHRLDSMEGGEAERT